MSTLVRGFAPAVVSEWRKVLSTPLWWLLALGAAGYLALVAGGLAFTFTLAPDQTAAGGGQQMEVPAEDLATSLYTLGPVVGYVFPLVAGAMAMTGEWRHRTITPTLLAQPGRGTVLTAKLLVNGVFGAFYGLVGTAAAVVAGAGVLALSGEPTGLGDGEVWVTLAWSVVALALWGVIGVAVGTLIPNQLAAVLLILGFTQFVEPLVRLGLAAFEATSRVAVYLPGAAAEALVGSSLYSASGLMDLLSRWQGGLVLLAYVAVLAVAGRLTTMRRDIT